MVSNLCKEARLLHVCFMSHPHSSCAPGFHLLTKLLQRANDYALYNLVLHCLRIYSFNVCMLLVTYAG